MSLLVADGFDIYSSLARINGAGWNTASGISFSSSLGRYGGGCLVNTLQANYAYIGLPATMTRGHICYIGWAYKHDGGGGASDLFLRGITIGGNQLFALRHNTTGDITALDGGGGSVGSSSGNPLTPNVYHWVECKVTTGTNATSGEIEVRVDGNVVLTSASNIDTHDADSGLAAIGFSGSNGNAWIDDVIINDNQGTSMTGYVGDSRINVLRVNGAGTDSGWTGADTDVDDALGAADDDSTYVSATTPATKEGYAMENLAVNPTSIHALVARVLARKSDAGPKTMRAYCEVAGTEAAGTTRALQTDYVWHRMGTFYVDPDTTSAWTQAGVNAAELGLEVIS